MSLPVKKSKPAAPLPRAYPGLVSGITELLEIARRASARTVNAYMTGHLLGGWPAHSGI